MQNTELSALKGDFPHQKLQKLGLHILFVKIYQNNNTLSYLPELFIMRHNVL